MTFEEEMATLQQFLRFGETKSIVELMALQDKESQSVIIPSSHRAANSDIRSFIESSGRRLSPVPSSESPGRSGGHHFESMVNSMAFMLPLHVLGSCPGSAPLLRSREESLQHGAPPGVELLDQNFTSEEISADQHSGTLDSEEFSMSDNYSSPSTPCTPSVSSDIAQASPESKLRPNLGTKKGRVYCSACEKTFYDKGTLKIHYNAVHLKIKHKCTIQGCNMVFSSLRSRNRHSANPNPRLHMPMNRNNRDRDVRDSLGAGDDPDRQDPTRSISEPRLHGSFSSLSHGGIVFPNLKTVQPVLPFYRSLVTPAELANTPGSLPSLPVLSSSLSEMENGAEPVPKKKSRKSSMPIKIEKDDLEECHESDNEDLDTEVDIATMTGRDEQGVISLEEPLPGRRPTFSDLKRDSLDQTGMEETTLSKTLSDPEACADSDGDLQIVCVDEEELLHRCESCDQTFKNLYSAKMHYRSVHLKEMHVCTVSGCNAAFPSRRSRDRHSANLNLHNKLLTKDSNVLPEFPPQDPLSQTSVIFKGSNRMGLVFPMSKVIESMDDPDEAVLDLSTRGSAHSSSWDSEPGSEEELHLEDSENESPAGLDQQVHRSSSPIACHVCQKVYSNKGTFRAHFKTVHLRLLHKCKVPGCETAFSSVRSRNRHSQNPNLHRNLPANAPANQE